MAGRLVANQHVLVLHDYAVAATLSRAQRALAENGILVGAVCLHALNGDLAVCCSGGGFHACCVQRLSSGRMRAFDAHHPVADVNRVLRQALPRSCIPATPRHPLLHVHLVLVGGARHLGVGLVLGRCSYRLLCRRQRLGRRSLRLRWLEALRVEGHLFWIVGGALVRLLRLHLLAVLQRALLAGRAVLVVQARRPHAGHGGASPGVGALLFRDRHDVQRRLKLFIDHLAVRRLRLAMVHTVLLDDESWASVRFLRMYGA